MFYLPDTNIFIEASKGNEPAASFLLKAINKKKLVISAVVVGEFLVKANQNEQENFEKLLLQFPALPVDGEIARLGAEFRKKLITKSKRVLLLDCFLAAQAKLNNLTLVTNDKSDFPIKGIKVITP